MMINAPSYSSRHFFLLDMQSCRSIVHPRTKVEEIVIPYRQPDLSNSRYIREELGRDGVANLTPRTTPLGRVSQCLREDRRSPQRKLVKIEVHLTPPVVALVLVGYGGVAMEVWVIREPQPD